MGLSLLCTSMNPQPTPKNGLLILILGLLTAIGPLSIDMYLPGFSVIADNLNTSIEMVGYSLSSFFVGICAGQLLSGPLLDRFGRKKPLYVGLVIYILASVGCGLSDSVEMLIGFRFLQALGGCVGMVAPSAVVRDSFPVEQSARVFSMLILILGVSPILAPTFGGFIVTGWGWKPVFFVLAGITLVILITVVIALPETKQPDPNYSLHPKAILGNFWEVIKNRQFMTYAMAGNTVSAGLFAYLAGSPFVFMEMHGVSQQAYGWIFGLIAAGLITASQINNLILKKHKSDQILRTVITIQVILGLIMWTGSWFQVFNLYSLIIIMMLFLSCQGFIFPNAAAMGHGSIYPACRKRSSLNGSHSDGTGCICLCACGHLFQ